MEVSSTMRHVNVIVLSLITEETDVKVCVWGTCGCGCVHSSMCVGVWVCGCVGVRVCGCILRQFCIVFDLCARDAL